MELFPIREVLLQEAILVKDMDKDQENAQVLGAGQGPPSSKKPSLMMSWETRKLQGISGCAWPVVQFGHPVS